MTEPTQLIEIIEGNYLDAFRKSVPETLHTSAEVQAKRVESEKIKDNSLNRWFYTANTPLYGMDGKTAIHFFGGREAFLRLYAPSIETVYTQIVDGRNNVYALPPEGVQWAKGEGLSSGALKSFELKSLIKTKDDDEYGYYTINTAKPDKLNDERRAHAELVHSAGEGFYAIMDMLKRAGISQTNVYLLLPRFIQKSSAEKGQIVGRGARLVDVRYYSGFDGGACGINDRNAFLGVRSSRLESQSRRELV